MRYLWAVENIRIKHIAVPVHPHNRAGLNDPLPKERAVVVMTAGGGVAAMIVNGLAARLGNLTLIEETPDDSYTVARKRAHQLGWPAVLSQAACSLLIDTGTRQAKARIDRIVAAYGVERNVRPSISATRVPSINGPEAHAVLRDLAPDVVATFGTKPLSQQTLSCAPAVFINFHPGLNPSLRGQHLAYWALAEGDKTEAGVTIELVSYREPYPRALYQTPCPFSPDDTIATYQYQQAAHGIPLFARAIQDALDGLISPGIPAAKIADKYPPTLGRYLWNGVIRGVW